MRSADPKLREIVRGWLAAEARADRPADRMALAAGRVYTVLSERLGRTIGTAGVQALFARSLRLVSPRYPYIQTPALDVDDMERTLQACVAAHPTGLVEEAVVVFFTTFLEVLISLLGEGLTWQLLRGLWPTEDAAPHAEEDPAP